MKFLTASILLALTTVLFLGKVQAQEIELLNNYTNAVEPSLIIKNSGGGTNNGAIVTSTIVAQAFGLSTNQVFRVPFINMTQTNRVSNLRIAIYGNKFVNGQAVPNLTNKLIGYLPSFGTNSKSEIQVKLQQISDMTADQILTPIYGTNIALTTNFLYTATFKADEINYSKVNTNNAYILLTNAYSYVTNLTNQVYNSNSVYVNTNNLQTIIKTGVSNGVLYLNTLQPTTNPYWIVYALVGASTLTLDAVTSETNSGSNFPYIGDDVTSVI